MQKEAASSKQLKEGEERRNRKGRQREEHGMERLLQETQTGDLDPKILKSINAYKKKSISYLRSYLEFKC